MVNAIDQNGVTIPLTTLPNGYLQGEFPVGSNVVTVTASTAYQMSAERPVAAR